MTHQTTSSTPADINGSSAINSLIPESFKRDFDRQTTRLFVVSMLLGALLSSGLWLLKMPIFEAIGGEFDRGRAIVPALSGADASLGAFWAYKLLYEGFITYTIIAATVAAVFYALGLLLWHLVPTPTQINKDLELLRRHVESPASGSLTSLLDLSACDGVGMNPSGRVMARLRLLERAYKVAPRRTFVREANDRLSTVEETITASALHHLVFLEWLLPILGFLGTVWGGTNAVDELRRGLALLFSEKTLSEVVLN